MEGEDIIATYNSAYSAVKLVSDVSRNLITFLLFSKPMNSWNEGRNCL